MSCYVMLYHCIIATPRESLIICCGIVYTFMCACVLSNRRRLRGNEKQTCKSSSKELSLLDPVCAQVEVKKKL